MKAELLAKICSYLNKDEWKLIVLDGHASNFDPAISAVLEANKLLLYQIPSHSSHLIQPLGIIIPIVSIFNFDFVSDMNFNGKLKAEVAKAIRNSTKRKLSKYDFIQVFLEGWQCTALGSVISSSFERSGMYPFNFEHLRRHFSNVSIAEYFEEHQVVSNPIIEEPLQITMCLGFKQLLRIC